MNLLNVRYNLTKLLILKLSRNYNAKKITFLQNFEHGAYTIHFSFVFTSKLMKSGQKQTRKLF